MSGAYWRGNHYLTPAGLVAGAVWADSWASLSTVLTRAGFPHKQFDTQAEAREYVEACYALWVAGGEE